MECVQIGTADTAMRNLYDGESLLGDWRREVLELDLLMTCNQSDLHLPSFQRGGKIESLGEFALPALST
jgi:hypothetical protein